jgi:hypothetical protein
MLLVEYGLGIGVNLYATLPSADRGSSLFVAVGRAVVEGPLVLTLHALLGTLLLLTAARLFVSSLLLRRRSAVMLAGTALIAVVAAWGAGARFVGGMASAASLTMALATALALLCYVVMVVVLAPRGPAAAQVN